MNQAELSERIGVSQGLLSRLERGTRDIERDLLFRLSEALRYPIGYFQQTGPAYVPTGGFYRKRAKLGKREREYLEAHFEHWRRHVEIFFREVEIETVNVPDLSRRGHFEMNPVEAARELRRFWSLPAGPIVNLVEVCERNGIVMLLRSLGTPLVDGLSLPGISPLIIILNSDAPTDRRRFTHAHELAHHVLHRALIGPEGDAEADAFASEFMMPAADIRDHFRGGLTLHKLADLKRYWGMSMGALLMRAHQLGCVTDAQKTTLWRQMSKLGYRTQEPPELSPAEETPRLLADAIKLYEDQLDYTLDELAGMVHLYPSEFMALYGRDKVQPRLRLPSRDW